MTEKTLPFLITWIFIKLQPSSTCHSIRQSITESSVQSNFDVYWNVPTFMCHKYGIFFEEVSKDFNIKQNNKDQFRGDKFFILYDPGYFPALLKDENGEIWRRNGGVPQEAVIDFESWRPIFRQNWASLNQYREISINIERIRHPFWSNKSIKKEAIKNFEFHGKEFMLQTLKLAKTLRPLAKWGYYAYPYCFNNNDPNLNCDPLVHAENDRLNSIFSEQHVLFPSVYLRKSFEENKRIGIIRARIREAIRISKKMTHYKNIFPYFWYKYQDDSNIFINKKDTENGIKEFVNQGADGLVIWGSSNDLTNKSKCQMLREYLKDVLGPIVSNIKISKRKEDYITYNSSCLN
ncbi:hyaluronidase B-like isoform X2 [Leptopilina heterotoma]|uniref:hyaluronidase B-like isoform X2 n=1 Tax=Leptopilina heterotoma TaxID=63436 RepID=UPI001CA81BBB|nr:hyaluronidase B-like isoform X2 [Leptopilina heterotoma]